MNQSMGRIGVSNFIGWRGDAAGNGEGEALDIAGDNRCGLVSGVFTRDIDRAFRHSEEMPTGTVDIDDASNYRALDIPFGGLSRKDSGTGRVGVRHAPTAICDLGTPTFSVT
jgi:aldehyde dehydrogenase (NAD+)